MQLTCDLSALHPELRQEIDKNLKHEDAAQQAIAWAEQERIAKWYRDAAVIGTPKTGIGPMRSCIHVGLQNLLAAHYGHAVAYRDPDFHKFILKKHDCFRVRDVGTRIQSGYTGNTYDPKRKAESGKRKLEVARG